MYKIYEDSKNYTGVVVKVRVTQKLEKLDNLVGVSVFGNLCLISKSDSLDQLYIFFPSETVLSADFLSGNNLYAHSDRNKDTTKKGYFEDNSRVKAIKFRGNKATGFLIPVSSLAALGIDYTKLVEGDEFNEINGIFICKKYVVPVKGSPNTKAKSKIVDNVVDKRVFPEHMDTDHLLKYIDHIDLNDQVVITTKLHGTSERIGVVPTQRKLSWKDKIAKWFGVAVQTEKYDYVVGSRHTVKSVGFKELKGKEHFYKTDLWSKVGQEYFEGRLNQNELVYFEVIGKDYTGKEIQPGYSYGLVRPDIYVYRISLINPQGVEVDLTWRQLKARCNELGIKPVPEIFVGSLREYMKLNNLSTEGEWRQTLENFLKKTYLDKPSFLTPSVIEEGICLRVERYPRPKTYKLKAPLFLIHEGVLADKQISNIEDEQNEVIVSEG